MLRRFVAGSLVIAVAGAVISLFAAKYPSAVASLLRFYWFRLSDAAVPMGTAIVGTSWIALIASRGGWLTKLPAVVASCIIALHLGQLCEQRVESPVPRADGPKQVFNYEGWRQTCDWIRENTATDMLFLTPRQSQTFKWYAQRSEVVTWKDVPQDATDLVEWWERMNEIHGTGASLPEPRFFSSLADSSVAHLVRIAREYKVDYLVTSSEPSLPLHEVYRNDSYAVYDLRSLRED